LAGGAPEPDPVPAKRADPRADALAVLSAATKALSLDEIHVEVNADSTKPHLPRGPLEVELEGLVASGAARKTAAGDYEFVPPPSDAIDPSPEGTRAVRAVLLTLIHAGITYPKNPDDDILHAPSGLTLGELALGILRGNQPKGPVFPGTWLEAFAGCAADIDRLTAALPPHVEALVATGLVRSAELELPPEPVQATTEDTDLAMKIIAVVGGDKDRFTRAVTLWTDAQKAEVLAWLAKDPKGSTDNDPEPIRNVTRIPTPPTNGDPGDGMLATVYLLTQLGQERFVERGALALAAQSLPGWVEPTNAEVKKTIDGLVDAERRRIEGEMTAERQATHGQLMLLTGSLEAERKVTQAYETWLKTHTKIANPRAFFLGFVPPPDPEGLVEDIEEEFKIDDTELRRMIIERDDLRAALSRIQDDHRAKKKVMEGVEDEYKEKIVELDAAVGRAARDSSATHIVKKRVVNVVEGGWVITRSADAHDRGKELRRIRLQVKQQIVIPGTGAPGEPEWSKKASPQIDPAPAASASAAPAVTTPTEPQASPVVAAPPATPPQPPTWTGKREVNLATVRRALVNDPDLLDLGLFQTVLGKDGILREELEDKLKAFFGASVDVAMLNKAIAAAIKAGDLLEGQVVVQGEGGATLTKTILWWKEVPAPAGILGENSSGKKVADPPAAGNKKAGGKKASAAKTPAGKAGAGKGPAPKQRR
jgi:hypothetical protein